MICWECRGTSKGDCSRISATDLGERLGTSNGEGGECGSLFVALTGGALRLTEGVCWGWWWRKSNDWGEGG